MSDIILSAFSWVPDFAQGQVRDLRVRWALEEIGQPYRTELLDATTPRPDSYREWQPFGQVPAFRDGTVRLFESGAILLYLGEQSERLLPRDAAARWQATAWLIAALNSVEPALMQIVLYDVFHTDEPWAAAARPSALAMAEEKLSGVAQALGSKDWLTGEFSVADIMMVTVLRILDHTDIIDQYPGLSAYRQRGMDRAAFKRALDAQCADFSDQPPQKGE